jgi:hypothetical protein
MLRLALGLFHILEWGPGAVSLGIKRQGAEFDHLLLCGLIIYGVMPPLPQCSFIEWCLITYWETFTFTSLVFCEVWGFLLAIFVIIILRFNIFVFYGDEYSYCCTRIMAFDTVWSGR